MSKEVFSFTHLLIKLTSRRFLIWLVSTIMCWRAISNGKEEYTKILVICYMSISIIYFIGDSLIDAIVKAVGNTDIKLGR